MFAEGFFMNCYLTATFQSSQMFASIRLRYYVGLNQGAFEEAVWHERAWELTAEYQVWFDMKRALKFFNGSGFENVVGYTLQNGKVIKKEDLYFLISQYEFDRNPNL